MASIKSITQGMTGQDAAALIRENDIAGTAPDWRAEAYTGPYMVSVDGKLFKIGDGVQAAANELPGVSPKWVPIGGDDSATNVLTSYLSDDSRVVDPLVFENYLIRSTNFARVDDVFYRTVEVTVGDAQKIRYQGRLMLTGEPVQWAAIVGELPNGNRQVVESSRPGYIEIDKTYDISRYAKVFVTYNFNDSNLRVIPIITLVGGNGFAQPDGVYKSVESVEKQLIENRPADGKGVETYTGAQAFTVDGGAGHLKTIPIAVKAGQQGLFKVYTDFAILDYFDTDLNYIDSPLLGSGSTVQSNATYVFPQDGFISVITGANLAASTFTLGPVGRIYLNAFKSIPGTPRSINLSENRYHQPEEITQDVELALADVGLFGMVNAFRFKGGGVIFGGAFDIAPGSKPYDPSIWNTIYIYNSYNRPTVLIVN